MARVRNGGHNGIESITVENVNDRRDSQRSNDFRGEIILEIIQSELSIWMRIYENNIDEYLLSDLILSASLKPSNSRESNLLTELVTASWCFFLQTNFIFVLSVFGLAF